MVSSIKNQSEKNEDDLGHQFISIWYDCIFSKWDDFSYNFVNNIYQIVWCYVNYLFFATMVI